MAVKMVMMIGNNNYKYHQAQCLAEAADPPQRRSLSTASYRSACEAYSNLLTKQNITLLKSIYGVGTQLLPEVLKNSIINR